ncbi:MAG: alpha/beta fold hydrolase [Alphaproteobacteria bacterium]
MSAVIQVPTPDGISIAAYDRGRPDGRSILLIHGYSQSHLSWSRQFTGELAGRFRLAAMDLRGHGASDKPAAAEAYQDGRKWADDVAAVIERLDLKRPVLVGWSFGGRVLCDYVRHHGQDRIGGLVYVGAATGMNRAHAGPGRASIPDMFSDDLATNIAGTRAFLRACTAAPMPAEDYEVALAYNMVVPAAVRRAMMARRVENDDVLRAVRLPTLVIHGEADTIRLPESGRHIGSLVPDALTAFYPGVGHSPFYEASERFDADIAAFVAFLPG